MSRSAPAWCSASQVRSRIAGCIVDAWRSPVIRLVLGILAGSPAGVRRGEAPGRCQTSFRRGTLGLRCVLEVAGGLVSAAVGRGVGVVARRFVDALAGRGGLVARGLAGVLRVLGVLGDDALLGHLGPLALFFVHASGATRGRPTSGSVPAPGGASATSLTPLVQSGPHLGGTPREGSPGHTSGVRSLAHSPPFHRS